MKRSEGRKSRKAVRLRQRRLQKFLILPRAFVLFLLAFLTIVAPVSGFVQANKPSSITAHALSLVSGESWSDLSTNSDDGEILELKPDPNARTRAHILNVPEKCSLVDTGSGNKELKDESDIRYFPLPRGSYTMTSPFGYRIHPISRILKLHAGTDFSASAGTVIRALSDGVVYKAGWDGGGGNTVYLEHNIKGEHYFSVYRHMLTGTITVQPGQKVKAGTVLGKVGSTGNSTGPHLHFEIRYPTVEDPHDPIPWLNTHKYSFYGEGC